MRRTAIILMLYAATVAAIIGLPWYLVHVAPWQRTVLTVGDETFTVRDVAERLRARSAADATDEPLQDSLKMLETIARERLILREAERRGLVPDEEEVRTELAGRVGETSRNMNDQDQRLAALRRAAGLSETEQVARFRLRRAAEALARDLSATDGGRAPAIRLTGTAFSNRQTAEVVARAARDSGDLAAVLAAKRLPGGDLGWTPKGVDEGRAVGQVQLRCADGTTWLTVDQARSRFPEVDWRSAAQGAAAGDCTLTARIPGGRLIDDIAFALPEGGVSPPLLTPEGFVVLQVTEKGQQPISPELAAELRRAALERWTTQALTDARAAGTVAFNWNSDTQALVRNGGSPLP